MSASEKSVPLCAPDPQAAAWPLLPTETEIYILPDGRVVIADLPAELAGLLAQLGHWEAADTPQKGETA